MRTCILVLVVGLLSGGCVSNPAPSSGDVQVLEVVAQGETPADADAEARTALVEQGIGVVQSRRSEVRNAQLTYDLLESSSEGFVRNYRRKSIRSTPGGLYEVTSTGDVSTTAIESALRERLKDVGNPRMMVLISESIFGVRSPAGNTKTENELIATLQREGFRFIDREQFKRILAQESGLTAGVYGNPTAEEKALEAAAQLNAEVLVIGESNILDNGEVRAGSGLQSVTADIKLKIISVGTAQVLATATETPTAAHAIKDAAVTNAIKKAVDPVSTRLKEQIAGNWKSGAVMRLTFQGIGPQDFLQSNIAKVVRRIRGVTGVDERSDSDASVLEVQCYCNTFKLARELLRRPVELDHKLRLLEIKGTRARFNVTAK